MGPSLIIGNGMVAQALADSLTQAGVACRMVGRPEIDLRLPGTLATQISSFRPATVFHTAALTRVTHCEQYPAEAMRLNGDATAAVTEAAAALGARLVYFSTDYVFSGSSGSALLEDCVPSPLNAYGRSKLAGENWVAHYKGGHIIRTSGVFGSRPASAERNFVRAIAHQLVSSDCAVPVVNAQDTCLTYSRHLAALLLHGLSAGLPPIAHITSMGHDSWYGWACRIASIAGLPAERITPVGTSELSDPVTRPQYSVLGTRFEWLNELMERFPAQAGLTEYLAGLSAATGGQY